MERDKTYRPGSLDRRGLSAGSGWLGEKSESIAQGSERGDFICKLYVHCADSALGRYLDFEAVKGDACVPGHLVGRQEVPLAVEERNGVGEGDGPEFARSLFDRVLVALLDAFLLSADFFLNLGVVKQAMGVHRGRGPSIPGLDRCLGPVAVREVRVDEPLLPRIEVSSGLGDARDFSGRGDFPGLDFARIEFWGSYHFLSFSSIGGP